MDPHKINFKSNKEPNFVFKDWSLYFDGMRAYHKPSDSWYNIKIEDHRVRAQLYPYGFFWVDVADQNKEVAEIAGAYAEYVLLCE